MGHTPFKQQASRPLCPSATNSSVTPSQLRWLPPTEVDEGMDFVDALFTVCGSGRCAVEPVCMGSQVWLLGPCFIPSVPHQCLPAALMTHVQEGYVCSPLQKDGYAIHTYTASASMQRTALCNADGDFLIVPQEGSSWPASTMRVMSKLLSQPDIQECAGTLHITTEFGRLRVPPGHICVVQCGM